MSLNSQQEQSLTAFISALAEQDQALPAGLQQQLQAIGQNLEARVAELPAIAASLPGLDQAYQQALAHPKTEDEKVTLVSTHQEPSLKLHERAVHIFTDIDPVQAAKHNQSRGLGQIASNPLKRLFGKG